MLLLALPLGIWAVTREPPGRWQTMPDGSLVTLAKVTYGTEHHFDQRRWWHWFSPARVHHQFGPGPAGGIQRPVCLFTSKTDVAALWLRQQRKVIRNSGYRHLTNRIPVDEHGCQFPRGRQHYFRSIGRSEVSESIFGSELGAFPRRGDSFEFHVIDDWRRPPVVKFTVPNPRPAAYPDWQPEPYPARRQQDDLTFTLLGIKHRDRGYGYRSAVRTEVRQSGRVTTDWRPAVVTVQDATGNSVTTRADELYRDGWRWFDALCRREKAWKVTVEFRWHGSALHGRPPVTRRTVEYLVGPSTLPNRPASPAPPAAGS